MIKRGLWAQYCCGWLMFFPADAEQELAGLFELVIVSEDPRGAVVEPSDIIDTRGLVYVR